MRSQANTAQDSTFEVIPSASWRISQMRVLPAYKLWVKFVDDLEGIVDLSELVTSENAGVFSQLRDTVAFNQAYLDHGAVTWPGEIDLAPDAMHSEIKQHGTWVIPA